MSTSEIRRLVGVGILVGLLSACRATTPQATFEATPGLAAPPASNVTASSVVVLKGPPQATYVELGTITLEWKGKSDDEAVLRLVREKAAEVGANAVLFLDSFAFDSWEPDGHGSGTRKVRSTYMFRALNISPSTQS